LCVLECDAESAEDAGSDRAWDAEDAEQHVLVAQWLLAGVVKR
jgi:hypothetical protein